MMDILAWLGGTILATFLVGLILLLLSDGDLCLMFKERFGKGPECLAGQVVWITGASEGIGEHLAYVLARAGCRLILSARREEQLQRVKKQCLLSGKIQDEDVLVQPLDMCKVHTHAEITTKVLEHFQQIDILLNNAGRSQRAFIRDTPLEIEHRLFDTNYFGPVSLTKAVLPHMIERKCGHLVVTSSMSGKIGTAFSASYAATKFALQGWYDAARLELHGDNIDVTMLCPGFVVSGLTREAFADNPDKKYGREEEPRGVSRMSSQRCADLMAVAIANRMAEVWISKQPYLLFPYVGVFMPDIFRRIAKFLGLKVLKKMREGDVLDR